MFTLSLHLRGEGGMYSGGLKYSVLKKIKQPKTFQISKEAFFNKSQKHSKRVRGNPDM
jgi:hypothetical protein